MEKMSEYLLVSYIKELEDSKILIDKVKGDWISNALVIVNCFPEYSSRLTQLLNHKLSYLNNNELFEQIDLVMPYPNMTQVWDPCDRRYQGFYNYLSDWVRKNVFSTGSYLFVSSRENLSVIKPFLRVKLESVDYKLASCYIKQGDPEPDFWVEKYNKPPLFEWENTNK